jgi:hypothetical protein
MGDDAKTTYELIG